LTPKAAQAEWASAEARMDDLLALEILSSVPDFGPTDLSTVALHFALSQKGSEALWREFDKNALKNLEEFKERDLTNIIIAFLKTEYTVKLKIHFEASDDLGNKLYEGLDQWVDSIIERGKSKDPYFYSDLVNKIQLKIRNPYGPGAVRQHTEGSNKCL
jgi:hypothetical protein